MKPTPEGKERLKALGQLPDWYGTCRVCGVRLEGTIAQLMEHKHGATTAQPEPAQTGT